MHRPGERAAMPSRSDRRRGAATVEYVALAGMIAILIVAAIAALVASPPTRGERELGEMLARRIACTPRYPVPCGRNPLALAYGFPLGKLVRSLAPAPASRKRGAARSTSATAASRAARRPDRRPGLTSSRRRVTEFTSVEDLRRLGAVRPGHLLALPARARLGANRSHGRRRRDRGGISDQAEPRGRPGPGPAGDAAGQRPLRLLPERRAAVALADRLPPGDLEIRPI